MMSDASAVSPENDKNVDPLELAAPVSQRVEIRSVALFESHTERTHEESLSAKDVDQEISVTTIEYARPSGSDKLFVRPSFSLTVTRRENDKDQEETLLTVKATFVLVYSAESFDGLNDENFEAFASTNGIDNAWPYWREFVQNTTARMGARPVTIPVFRFG